MQALETQTDAGVVCRRDEPKTPHAVRGTNALGDVERILAPSVGDVERERPGEDSDEVAPADDGVVMMVPENLLAYSK
jgi:hypothetical protein